MAPPLKICFAASEISPFAKTGGLADVAAALPRQLHRQGHEVRVFVPLHAAIDTRAHRFLPVEPVRDVTLRQGARAHRFSLRAAREREDDPTVHFVDCPELFNLPGIYNDDPDEPRRFALFSAAVIESCRRMDWAPDLFHCNDWHTALIPLLLKTADGRGSSFPRSKTVLTIHNIGFQGICSGDWIRELGLADRHRLLDREDLLQNRFSFLKTGLIHADMLTTVSPTHAIEIQTEEYGMGLQELLRSRADRLVGILNGVDYEEWGPERDRFIPHHYSARRLAGKAKNKAFLLEQLGLPGGPEPLLGMVSRLTHQKGLDLCVPVFPEVLATHGMRLAVLGTGEAKYERFFEELQRRFRPQVAFYRGYSNELAHLIEAGSDMFVMPSLYEPCGLNQMFSLRYGTIPIVRRTGGLRDTVSLFDPSTGEGTGIAFENFDPQGLRWALDYAIRLYHDKPAWRRLVRNAMSCDHSWEARTRRYVELYRWLIQN